MKKFFAILISATFLVAPLAQAQERQRGPQRGPQVERPVERNIQRPAPRADNRRHVQQPRWARGQRLSDHDRRRASEVRDFRRHRLAPPPRGYRWVRVDNQFILVGIASGIISSIIAGGR